MRYFVEMPFMVWVTGHVEADSEEEAYEKASNEFPKLGNFCGNGGCDKLVGVTGKYSVEACDEHMEGEYHVDVCVTREEEP